MAFLTWTGQSQITNRDPRVIWSRNCWELIIDSLENLPNFLQRESHVLYTLTPIYLQNNTLFPCSSSSTMSACWGPFLNEWGFKHAQPFPQTLSVTASLPVSTTVNPSLWCAVRLSQHPGRVSPLVLKSSLVTWLHFTCFRFPLLVTEGICYGLVPCVSTALLTPCNVCLGHWLQCRPLLCILRYPSLSLTSEQLHRLPLGVEPSYPPILTFPTDFLFPSTPA